MMDILGWFIAALLVLATIGIHYEIMRLVSDIIVPWALRISHNRRVMMLITGTLMLGHIAEIWMFAFAMWAMSLTPIFGGLSDNIDGSLSTFLYFSAVNYTSTGYGDITPHGCFRSISVSEALTGLLMIAWSASFTYIKMEKIWNMRRRSGKK